MQKDDVLESSYKTRIRQSDQLKTVLALCVQDILRKNMPPSCWRLQTMVKKFLDQKIRSQFLRPETKEPCQEHRRKAEAKGSLSAVRESTETGRSGKQEGSVPGRKLEVSATIIVDVELFLSDSKRRRRTMMGQVLSKGRPPRGSSPSQPRQEYLKGHHTSCDSWHSTRV